MRTFVKLIRGEMAEDLLEKHPNAFLLLSLIAIRARRTPNMIKNLDICECQIGDFRSCGLTEQKYRTAKKVLENLGIVTFQPTRYGTVAKIVNTDIYDINVCEVNGQNNEEPTDSQRTGNGQVTTNKNVKKERMEEDIPPAGGDKDPLEKISPEVIEFVKTFNGYIDDKFGRSAPRRTDKSFVADCNTIRLAMSTDKFSLDDIKSSLRWAHGDSFWQDQIKSLAQIRRKGQDGTSKLQKIYDKSKQQVGVQPQMSFQQAVRGERCKEIG